MFEQMVKGIKALHDLKIFHRDLKVTKNGIFIRLATFNENMNSIMQYAEEAE